MISRDTASGGRWMGSSSRPAGTSAPATRTGTRTLVVEGSTRALVPAPTAECSSTPASAQALSTAGNTPASAQAPTAVGSTSASELAPAQAQARA